MAGANFVTFIAFVTGLPLATAKTLLRRATGDEFRRVLRLCVRPRVAPASEEQIAAKEENQQAPHSVLVWVEGAWDGEGADKQKYEARSPTPIVARVKVTTPPSGMHRGRGPESR